MVAETDVEAERDFVDINVARVAVVIAVSDAEGEFTLTKRVAVVDGE
jgi:hypothetical protein